MEETYKNGLAEVDMILNYADEESLNKIPESLKKFIRENKSDYTAQIDPEKDLKDQNLLYETKVILAVLYRDFWATENERKYLHQKEKEELIKLEKIKQEKYSYTNLFQNKNTLNQINLENRKSLIVKENMLRRILNKIKRFFRLGVN